MFRPAVLLLLLVGCGFSSKLQNENFDGNVSTPDAPMTCSNGAIDNGESDVDCGGPCPMCDLGQKCGTGKDCTSGKCDGGVCVAAICGDGELGGTELCDLGGQNGMLKCVAGVRANQSCSQDSDCGRASASIAKDSFFRFTGTNVTRQIEFVGGPNRALVVVIAADHGTGGGGIVNQMRFNNKQISELRKTEISTTGRDGGTRVLTSSVFLAKSSDLPSAAGTYSLEFTLNSLSGGDATAAVYVLETANAANDSATLVNSATGNVLVQTTPQPGHLVISAFSVGNGADEDPTPTATSPLVPRFVQRNDDNTLSIGTYTATSNMQSDFNWSVTCRGGESCSRQSQLLIALNPSLEDCSGCSNTCTKL